MARHPARIKRLTEQDRSDWASFARHIALLPGRNLPDLPPEPPPAAVADAPPQPTAPKPPSANLPARPVPVAVGLQPGGLDNATWNRFRAGKLPAVRTLDLHGRTAQNAYHALHSFLLRAHADHLRVVEIITGRGSGEGGGIIKREFPIWLNLPALRPLVLAASHPHAANTGSVRLLQRRPK